MGAIISLVYSETKELDIDDFVMINNSPDKYKYLQYYRQNHNPQDLLDTLKY